MKEFWRYWGADWLRDLYVSRAGTEGTGGLVWMKEFLEVLGCGLVEGFVCQ